MEFRGGLWFSIVLVAVLFIVSACTSAPAQPAPPVAQAPPPAQAPSATPPPAATPAPAAPPVAAASPPATAAESEMISNPSGYLLNTTLGSCYDSDRGVSQDVKGYVIDKAGIRHDDTCEANNNVLREYYCSEFEKDYLGVKYIQCSLCQDGRCVPPPAAPKFCVESEAKSLDFSTAGFVTDTRTNAVYNDTCSTQFVLFKYYCDFSDHAAKRAYSCPNGCRAAACVP